jgi:hypothetical protein
MKERLSYFEACRAVKTARVKGDFSATLLSLRDRDNPKWIGPATQC